MRTGLVNYRITPSMDDGSVIVRRARSAHRCWGGHDGQRRTRCDAPIIKGMVYIEYIGETTAFQSGQRYHVKCAVQQGLVEPLSEVA